MIDSLRRTVLRLMRVPPEPEPPAGAPASVRVFNAAPNFFKLRLLGWSVTQLFAIAGIIFWLHWLGVFENQFEEARHQIQREQAASKVKTAKAPAGATSLPAPAPSTPALPPSAPAMPSPNVTPVSAPARAEVGPESGSAPKPAQKKTTRRGRSAPERLVRNVPSWFFFALKGLEVLGIIGFVVQLPLTCAALRLDYEMRWYIVTDRSLRIRSGIWRVQEITMSFANIQQVVVTRGPVQGLLKISDVRVQSAGGGGGEDSGHGESLHNGVFHGVANAPEIRDLILERLRQFRATGLGDPDDAPDAVGGATTIAAPASATLAAAQELLAEARALRAAL